MIQWDEGGVLHDVADWRRIARRPHTRSFRNVAVIEIPDWRLPGEYFVLTGKLEDAWFDKCLALVVVGVERCM
jgi:hypothetical protein